MAISDTASDLIDKYLSGETLTSSEQAEFDKLKKESEEFLDELMLRKGMVAVLKAKAKAQKMAVVREMVKNTDDEDDMPKSGRQLQLGRWQWLVAASVLFMVFFGLYTLRFYGNAVETEEIFNAYYEPLPLASRVRAGDTLKLDMGLELYNKQEYEKAIPYLKAFLLQSERSNTVALYLGIAYLETNNYTEAEAIFDKTIQNSNDQFLVQHASWYLALLSLKKDNIRQAVRRFKRIAHEEGIYDTSARAVLDDLE